MDGDENGSRDPAALLRVRANMVRGRRAQGGHLTVTDRRLTFEPHIFERLLGGRAWSLPLADVTSVEIADRDGNPFDGSLRGRLAIASAEGRTLFVVPHAEDTRELLQDLLRKHQ